MTATREPRSPPADPAEAHGGSAAGPPLAVLYVDDDQAIRRLVEKHLSRQGFRVALADGGPAALAALDREIVDVVALDHFMPGMDGLELLALLRQRAEPPPAIFVTGADDSRIAVTALKAGASDYVVKDVQGGFLDLLVRAVEQAAEQERLRRAHDLAQQEIAAARDRFEQVTIKQTILLREMNHRVANSLHLISSLLQLQARQLADPAARALLEQAIDRVHAITLVHRRLYTSEDVETVEIAPYLRGLIDDIRASVVDDQPQCTIDLTVSPLKLATDRAVAIGVIVNELVTNALKYAFPGRRDGAITVRFDDADPRELRLTVADDGVGFAEMDTTRGTGLGATIVSAMAGTLRATLIKNPQPVGTCFTIVMAA